MARHHVATRRAPGPAYICVIKADPIPESLLRQASACDALGSPLYARLLRDLETEYARDGIVADILRGSSSAPVHDAVPLRFLGALHREVLTGRLANLAVMYPSVGGDTTEYDFREVLAAIREVEGELRDGLHRQVQTNEVGRSVVHLALSHWLGRGGVDTFDFLEVGASAGLNLCFPEFSANTGHGVMGTHGSPVGFDATWFDLAPPVCGVPSRPVRLAGCDPHPIDATGDEGSLTLTSFVWPDQADRLSRLRGAIEIARRVRPPVDRASADEWIARQLEDGIQRTTVVFHSIVWQYLSRDVQRRFRDAVVAAGERATPTRKLVWARMEPAGPTADVQVDVWDGGSDPVHTRLATIGYHGQAMTWNLHAADTAMVPTPAAES